MWMKVARGAATRNQIYCPRMQGECPHPRLGAVGGDDRRQRRVGRSVVDERDLPAVGLAQRVEHASHARHERLDRGFLVLDRHDHPDEWI